MSGSREKSRENGKSESYRYFSAFFLYLVSIDFNHPKGDRNSEKIGFIANTVEAEAEVSGLSCDQKNASERSATLELAEFSSDLSRGYKYDFGNCTISLVSAF